MLNRGTQVRTAQELEAFGVPAPMNLDGRGEDRDAVLRHYRDDVYDESLYPDGAEAGQKRS